MGPSRSTDLGSGNAVDGDRVAQLHRPPRGGRRGVRRARPSTPSRICACGSRIGSSGRPATSRSSSTQAPAGWPPPTRSCRQPGSQPPPPGAATSRAGRSRARFMCSTTRPSSGEPAARTPCGRCSARPQRLYAQLTLASHNERMPPPWGPASFVRYLRWAWLVEGGAQYLAGQVALFSPAVGRRLSEGDPAVIPPRPPRRDHPRRHGLRPARPRGRRSRLRAARSRGCARTGPSGRWRSPSASMRRRSRAHGVGT